MSANKKPWIKSVFNQIEERDKIGKIIPNTAKKKSEDETCVISCRRSTAHLISTSECSVKLPATLLPNWVDNFAPTKTDDLAIHPKKLAELQEWLSHCKAVHRKHPAQICLLTGPTGCGKTTAIKLLAQIGRYNVQEWINPVDRENIVTLGDQMGSYVGSQVDAFKSFILRASRYKSILEGDCDKRLLLVEDFPNFLINDSAAFTSILEDFICYGKSPLVFVVADVKTKHLNISFNLFPDEIKNKFNIKHINFNPIASTLMNKAIKRFCMLMAQQSFTTIYRVPQQTVIDSIAINAQGDIRNGLINLHFASLKGAPGLQTKELKLETKKINQKKQYTLKSIGRDESITMLHVLGRIFNPKYMLDKRFVHSPESLVDFMPTQPKKMLDFIHANYLGHFADIDNVIVAVDGLSLADIILNEYREEICSLTGLNTAIRSVMCANKTPVTGWKSVRGPKRLTIAKPLKTDLEYYELRQNMSTNLYATEYNTFIKHISSKREP